jgi:hypothetical protein
VGPRLPDNLLVGWSLAGHNESVQRIRTYARKWPCYAKSMGRKPRGRSAHFNGAAEATGGQVLVPLDKDIADWLCKQGDLVREVNDLCRFYMDTSISRELEFDLEEFEAAQASTRVEELNP